MVIGGRPVGAAVALLLVLGVALVSPGWIVPASAATITQELIFTCTQGCPPAAPATGHVSYDSASLPLIGQTQLFLTDFDITISAGGLTFDDTDILASSGLFVNFLTLDLTQATSLDLFPTIFDTPGGSSLAFQAGINFSGLAEYSAEGPPAQQGTVRLAPRQVPQPATWVTIATAALLLSSWQRARRSTMPPRTRT